MKEEVMLLRIQGYEPLQDELNDMLGGFEYAEDGETIPMMVRQSLFFIYGGECVPIKKGADVTICYGNIPMLISDGEYDLRRITCWG